MPHAALQHRIGSAAAARIHGDDALVGRPRSKNVGDAAHGQRAAGNGGAFASGRLRRRRVQGVGHLLERGFDVFVAVRHANHAAVRRHQIARQVAVGEEAHWAFGAEQHQLAHRSKEFENLFGKVRQTVDQRQRRPGFHPRREGRRIDLATGLGGDSASRDNTALAQAAAVDEQHAAGIDFARCRLDHFRRHLGAGGCRLETRRLRGRSAFAPGAVGRQNQRRHAAGGVGIGRHRRAHGIGGVEASPFAGARRADPRRHRLGHRLHIRGEGRVVGDVVDGVVADDVHQRRCSAATVVQVGDAVAEAGAEVQQGRRRQSLHARVAVCGAGADALEQAQHGARFRHRVDGLHEMHLGRARIGEAGVHAVREEGSQHALGTVHGLLPRRSAKSLPYTRTPSRPFGRCL